MPSALHETQRPSQSVAATEATVPACAPSSDTSDPSPATQPVAPLPLHPLPSMTPRGAAPAPAGGWGRPGVAAAAAPGKAAGCPCCDGSSMRTAPAASPNTTRSPSTSTHVMPPPLPLPPPPQLPGPAEASGSRASRQHAAEAAAGPMRARSQALTSDRLAAIRRRWEGSTRMWLTAESLGQARPEYETTLGTSAVLAQESLLPACARTKPTSAQHSNLDSKSTHTHPRAPERGRLEQQRAPSRCVARQDASFGRPKQQDILGRRKSRRVRGTFPPHACTCTAAADGATTATAAAAA